MTNTRALTSNWFNRLLLPGFAFKAVVIGGGYATGRELTAFFLPSGPWGGLYGMALSTVIWSTVCAITFLFAIQTGSRDYRSFFSQLLGPCWPAFELAYLLAIVVILAVFAAAAGAIGEALFQWRTVIGSLILVSSITLFAGWGNDAVDRLFKYVSVFLYLTYAAFLVLSLTTFGDRIVTAFATEIPTTGWLTGGLSYAGYNVVGAVTILPIVRHLQGRKDALIAGLLAGPLAMLPAVLFFIAMAAFYPQIQSQTLPSDFLLEQLHLPFFRYVFQAMIFAALLESGTGCVHAINERIAQAYAIRRGSVLSRRTRLAITITILIGSVFVADRVGLVSLIANGYQLLAYLFLGLYVLPLMTVGLWRVLRGSAPQPAQAIAPLPDA